MPGIKRMRDSDDSKPDEMLIIALDFGTTYSGIAYTFANQKDPKVVAIMDWPGKQHLSRLIIPCLKPFHSMPHGTS